MRKGFRFPVRCWVLTVKWYAKRCAEIQSRGNVRLLRRSVLHGDNFNDTIAKVSEIVEMKAVFLSHLTMIRK